MTQIVLPNFDCYVMDAFAEHRERKLAELSLYEFVKQAWHVIEGVRPFSPGWHIEALCAHLECVANGTIKKLLVNVPPRTSKSTIISCMFPAWIWISQPERQILSGSHSLPVSSQNTVKCRRVISSDWYQKRWGHIFKIVGDQNTKTKFENNKTGYHIAISVSGGVTGLGGDLKILDDPNNAGDKESDVVRNSTNLWGSIAWSTRKNNPKTIGEVVVQQRLHAQDYTGNLIEHDVNNRWVKLILPMRFCRERRAKTIILPGTKIIWEDPREREGELLWPGHLDEESVKELEDSLRSCGGEYEVSGQLQQLPAPDDLGILRKSQFRWWEKERPPKIDLIVSSWDTAIETDELAAYSAVTTWGLFRAPDGVTAIILLGMWRGKLEMPELLKLAVNISNDYRDNGDNDITPDSKHQVDITLIEAKASGSPLIQSLRRKGVNAVKFIPKGDKIGRARLASAFLESGQIYVPAQPPDYKRLRPNATKFLDMCSMFPLASTRDVVDTFSQVVEYLRKNGHLRNRYDVKDTPYKPPTFSVYAHDEM